MPKNKIKVLIADDSMTFRQLVRRILDPEHFIIVAEAADSYEAEEKIWKLKPDAVVLDVEMPGISGIELLKKMMKVCPFSAVVVSSTPITVFDALEAGAVEFVRKPLNQSREAMQRFQRELSRKLKIAASGKSSHIRGGIEVKNFPPLPERKRDEVVLFGASTGGTDAVQAVLQGLPENMPPVLVVQHMPAGFTKMYAERMDRVCKMEVKEAEDGMRLKAGMAVIAAGEYHLRLKKDENGYYISSKKGEKVSGHCPSVDVLFLSAAKCAGKDAIGVIMTGMGEDGAKGLLAMKKAGAFTIGQDEKSCVVYGMPMAAKKLGAVQEELPLEKIAEKIYEGLK